MNQETRLVTADGSVVANVSAVLQRNACIDAMAKLGRRMNPDFNVARFKQDAGYVEILTAH